MVTRRSWTTRQLHQTPLKLYYEFMGWLGDDLLETTPCFIVTLALKESLVRLNGTGYSFDEVTVLKSNSSREKQSKVGSSRICLAKITGEAGRDDAGLDTKRRLVVSDEFLNVLRKPRSQLYHQKEAIRSK